MQHYFDLDTPLIHFSDQSGAPAWTIRQAVEGAAVFGSMGAGKSSSVIKYISQVYLSNGFGGLFLTAKPDDAETYLSYCEKTGRLDDVIVVEPNCSHYFNVIDYEANHQQAGKSYTQNLTEVLTTIVESSESKNAGTDSDPFWGKSLKLAVNQVIELSMLAYGRVSAQLMYDIIISAPKSEGNPYAQHAKEKTAFEKAFEMARDKVNEQMKTWREARSAEASAQGIKFKMTEAELEKAVPDARRLKLLDQFFNETYRTLSDKTRSIIDFSFSGFLFNLLQEPMYSLFCEHESNYTPDDCLNGKIIILNLPVKIHYEAGRDIATMFKFLFQRAIERRDVKVNPRPVFLIADEAQFFLHPKDTDCQSTARSSRLATVYATQNLPNYFSNMSGQNSEYKVKSFLATLNSKFFCSNNCVETNQFASTLVGSGYTENPSRGSTMSGQFSVTTNLGFQLEALIRPEHFQRLKTGGPLNNYLVECYMHTQGFQFPDGLNFRKIAFNQL